MSRILLIGMGPTTATALESLAERFAIVGLVRPLSDSVPDPVHTYAEQLAVPIFHDAAPKAVAALIRQLQPDGVVISSYNRVIGAEMLRLGRFVNVHYAPLPQYRGRANVNWAIINGEPEAAISIHTVVPGLDAGNILFQQALPLDPHAGIGEVYAALNELQRRHLGITVQRWLAGYAGEPQDAAAATYGCTRTPADGLIDWAAPTTQVYALIRALMPPYPGACTFLEGRRLAILRARPLDDPPNYVGRIPGRVIARNRHDGWVDVLTGDGVLRIFEVQVAGEPPVPAAQVITSVAQTLGLRTLDLLDRIAALEAELARMRAG